MNSNSRYRMNYTDLHYPNGTAKGNVYADVSMTGLAPVLGNPVCLFFFLKHMQTVVSGLRLQSPSSYDSRPLAIKTLKALGYYGEAVPSGLRAKWGFYLRFLQQM